MPLRNEDENEDFESINRWNKRITHCVWYTIRTYAHILSGVHSKWLLSCIRRIAYSVTLELCWMPLRWHSKDDSIHIMFPVALENQMHFRWHLKIWYILGGTWKLKPRRDFQWTPRLPRPSSRRFHIILLLKQRQPTLTSWVFLNRWELLEFFGCEIDSFRYLLQMVCSKIRLLQIVVEKDFGGKVAVPLAEQLGYMACYANSNNGPRFE